MLQYNNAGVPILENMPPSPPEEVRGNIGCRHEEGEGNMKKEAKKGKVEEK
jgi:hypothetical protein